MVSKPVGARDIARAALARVRKDDVFASVALDELLRSGDIDPRDRALATELTYGVLRHRTRLDHAIAHYASRGLSGFKAEVRDVLRLAAYQLLFLERVPAHAAVDDAVSAASKRHKRVAGAVNAILRALAKGGEPGLPTGDSKRVEVEYSLPADFVEELKKSRPNDWLSAARAFSEPAPTFVRVNSRRATAAQLVKRLEGEGARAEVRSTVCVEVTGMGSPTRSAAFRQGLFSVQDWAAQEVIDLLELAPGASVLDACCGRGGKTMHLAEKADVAIDAVDLSPGKVRELEEHQQRLGLHGIRALSADLTGSVPELAETYDAVIIDAPCTGLGVIRRHPERKWRSSAWSPVQAAGLQGKLLPALASRVRPGGQLLYVVCTFTAQEGPGQVEQFLAQHPEFARQREDYRAWPDDGQRDGFYAALLRRTADC